MQKGIRKGDNRKGVVGCVTLCDITKLAGVIEGNVEY